jgi:signal peptide peptidase SppA
VADEPKYQHILTAVYSRPWAILPATLALIVDILQFRAAGGTMTDEEIQARVAAADNGPRKGEKTSGSVAIIPVYGPITQRQSLMGASSSAGMATSVEGLTADFRAALADPEVDAIVFEFDSPGGTVDGVAELAAEIRDARGTKPIVAQANTMAASAAYWLAASCDEIVSTPSGVVGSVGVFAAHQDVSKAAEMDGVKVTLISAGKYKTEGNRWEPLSDEARADIQDQVDQIYATFTGDLAKSRGVPVETIRKSYGEGRVMLAKKALAAGMVDRIDTLDNTIRRVARQAVAAQRQASIAALDPELPFTARLALVSAASADLVEHATARLDMRAREGRSLTQADRAGLLATADALRALATTEEPDPEPPEEPAPSPWAKAAALRLELARAEHGF